MENLGRQNIDHGWRDVFSGAEGPLPSDDVWLAIDKALTATDSEENKKRVVFYQRLAASLFLLTTLSVMISYWKWNGTASSDILSQTTPAAAEVSGEHSSSAVTEEKNRAIPGRNLNKKTISGSTGDAVVAGTGEQVTKLIAG